MNLKIQIQILQLEQNNLEMGNKAQKVEDNKQTFASSIKHPKLYNAKYVKPYNEEQAPYLQVAQQVQSKQIYQKWKKGISRYQVQGNELQTILTPKQLQFQQKGLCGSSGVIRSRYPVLPFVLSEQIINRAHLKQSFLEKELWYLLYILNVAGSTAHSRGITLGDVRPENILMSEDGEICVCCLQSFLDQQKNYHKTLSMKLKTYLAPEQMKDLQGGKDDCTQDQTVSESFSIGLSVLAAMLLKNQSELYGIDFSFDEASFSKQLHNLRNLDNYSPILKKIVEGMLTTSPASRLTSQEIVKLLKPYQEQIINLQDFKMTEEDIPEEIKQKISFQPSSSRKRQQRQFLKVINNNDFNVNSRIRYSQSPRNSQVNNYPQPSPINSQFRPAVQYGNPPAFVMRQPQIVERPMSPNFIINHQNFNPNLNPNMNPNQNYTIRQQMPNNRNPPVTVTQSMYTPAQRETASFPMPPLSQNARIISPPQMRRPVQSNIIQLPLTRQMAADIPPYYRQFAQPPREMLVPAPVLVSEVSNPMSNVSSQNTPSFVNYASNISSFIPNQYNEVMNHKFEHANNQYKVETKQYRNPEMHFELNEKINFQKPKTGNSDVYSAKFSSNIQPPVYESYVKPMPEFNPTRLTEYARQSYSIKPTGEVKNSNNSKVYQSYEQAMKNIDNKLRQSRRLFPDGV